MWHKIQMVLLALTACGLLGLGLASGDGPGPDRYSFVLSPEEIGLARDLAEKELPGISFTSGPRTVFIKMDLLPDSQAATNQRCVMVHHYQYPNDETIFTMIDLRSHEILKREIIAHYPTALAPSEVEHALQLAHGDDRLWHFFKVIPTEFETRPIQFANIHEPLFGHRVVHVLMRQEGNYLVNPRVLVDLTTEAVVLEMNQPTAIK